FHEHHGISSSSAFFRVPQRSQFFKGSAIGARRSGPPRAGGASFSGARQKNVHSAIRGSLRKQLSQHREDQLLSGGRNPAQMLHEARFVNGPNLIENDL